MEHLSPLHKPDGARIISLHRTADRTRREKGWGPEDVLGNRPGLAPNSAGPTSCAAACRGQHFRTEGLALREPARGISNSAR